MSGGLSRYFPKDPNACDCDEMLSICQCTLYVPINLLFIISICSRISSSKFEKKGGGGYMYIHVVKPTAFLLHLSSQNTHTILLAVYLDYRENITKVKKGSESGSLKVTICFFPKFLEEFYILA